MIKPTITFGPIRKREGEKEVQKGLVGRPKLVRKLSETLIPALLTSSLTLTASLEAVKCNDVCCKGIGSPLPCSLAREMLKQASFVRSPAIDVAAAAVFIVQLRQFLG